MNLPKDSKEELRKSLIEEQGYICCYCLKRIPEGKAEMHHTKIEHFKCQEKHSHLDLEYSNMHLACMGNMKNPKKRQTCDTHKANIEIDHFSLIDDSLNNRIAYARNGQIISNDESINKELNEVLNLNDQNLRQAREAVHKGISNALKRLHASKKLNARALESLIKSHSLKTKGKYIEYFPVVIYYLKKKIRQYT